MYYPAQAVEIELTLACRVQEAYRLWRAGKLSLLKAIKYTGPSFNDDPQAGVRLNHFVGGTTVNVCLRDVVYKTEVRYVYPLHTINRVKVV